MVCEGEEITKKKTTLEHSNGNARAIFNIWQRKNIFNPPGQLRTFIATSAGKSAANKESAGNPASTIIGSIKLNGYESHIRNCTIIIKAIAAIVAAIAIEKLIANL